jgi:hypothetical protein
MILKLMLSNPLNRDLVPFNKEATLIADLASKNMSQKRKEGVPMIRRYLSCAMMFAASLAITSIVQAQANKKPDLSAVPRNVLESLKSKFPKAEIHKWSKEKEGDIVVYDFEFKQEGQKFEADIKEDGTIHNWEQEISPSDLPDAVRKALKGKYPNSAFREIMKVTAVNNGQDELEGYEIVLTTAGKKQIEVMVAPDGRILEEETIQARRS